MPRETQREGPGNSGTGIRTWSDGASAHNCSIQGACCSHPLSFNPGHCTRSKRKVWKLRVWKEDAGRGAGPPELQLGLLHSVWWYLEGPSLLGICTPKVAPPAVSRKAKATKATQFWMWPWVWKWGKGMKGRVMPPK